MSIVRAVKNFAEGLPPAVGLPLARVPFIFRLGPAYEFQRRRISAYEALADDEAEAWLIAKLRRLVTNAHRNVWFYQDLYTRHGVDPNAIQRIADFRQLPFVNKASFQQFPFEARSYRHGLEINTGGTSGEPLFFQVEKNAFAREWAHMHRIWYARGYRKEHVKLTFRGKHFDRKESLRYNAPHNELLVNANASMSEVLHAALAWDGPPIRWLHGYPSLISEFAHALDEAISCSRERFRSGLFGVLLGSEYPALAYRKPIEEKLSINVVSWYGHSEMAVLAAETMRGVYRSLPTYGFAEAIPIENSNGYRLICTSFDNYCHPFIRYDTGDIIEPLSDGMNGLCFRILEGRIGDFILDRHGRRHSLTAVIFGRHHPAFANLAHVQVSQQIPGRATLLVTLRERTIPLDVISAGFDLSGVDIEWDISIVAEPIRSKAGKIKLKVD